MINASMTIAQVLEMDPGVAYILLQSGLKRLGALLERDESIAQVAVGNDICAYELMAKINGYLLSKQLA